MQHKLFIRQLWILVIEFHLRNKSLIEIFLRIELMTTPQLHYAVRCYNDHGLYGHYNEAGYFDKLCTAFQNILEVN